MGEKQRNKEIEDPKSEPEVQKPNSGYHVKYWVGRKF
jgi:hypothetical protein